MEQKKIRLLRPDEIECRIGSISEKGLSLLLFMDARAAQNILDETFTPFGWRRTHQEIGGRLYCTVEVWDEEKKQWISKQDVGTESFAEKEKGAAGMVGLETAFGVCYTKLCREQRLPLELLSFLMSAGPAAVLGLADHKGMLAPGYDADVVLVDLDHMYEVSAEDLHSKSKNCPYDGTLLYGKVVTTIKGGKVTFQIEE